MIRVRATRLIIIAGMGCIAASLTLWPVPYGEVAMLAKGFLLQWTIAAVLAGCLSRILMRQSFSMTALFIACGFALATFGRVVFELIKDSTSHNLWPFEVAIAIVVGGLGGAALAWKVKAVK